MPRTPSRRTAVRLVLAITVGTTLAGCGSSPADDVPDNAVAVVNGEPITQASYDRWYEIAKGETEFAGSPLTEEEIRSRVLSTLIRAKWVRGEAEELGITVPKSELEEEWEQASELTYAGDKTFEEYMQQTGLTEEELRYRIETGETMIYLTRASQARAGGADDPDVDAKMLDYSRDYTERWKALTVCAEDHLIGDCSNYDGADVGSADEAEDSPAQ